eukprot:jgi/Ulvmu1/7453/UM036_0115.1
MLPLRLVHGIFGLACKATLGPMRAVLGQRIPHSNRRHLVLLLERLENLLGSLSFAQEKATVTVLRAGHHDVQLVTRVSQRIIDALPQGDSGRGYVGHLARCEWEVAVVRSCDVNATVMPGGKIVVYTGLLDMIDRDEDKLAAVLGHEAAHVVARHIAEGVGLRVLLGGVGWLVCSAVGSIVSAAHLLTLEERHEARLEKINKRYRAAAVGDTKLRWQRRRPTRGRGPSGTAAALLTTHSCIASHREGLEQEVAYMMACGWRVGHAPTAAVDTTAARSGYFSV